MKTLKIPTYWTVDIAEHMLDCVRAMETSILENYGDAIQIMHREIQRQSRGKSETQKTLKTDNKVGFDDDMPF